MKSSSFNVAVPTALAGAFIGVAFALGLQTTAGLQWPCEIDFYRDMGGAQVILDGRFGEDPSYLGELNWFNPLQPALFALLSRLTGLPLHVLYAQAGPFVNLLGPIAFYILACTLLGRWPALAALGAYLYLGRPDVPSWFQATYSPWAWPMNFAQGFFYLTVAAYVRAVTTRRLRWDFITGILLGFTFLAHTAPTLVFVMLLTLMTLVSPRGERGLALRRFVLIGVVSLTIASPYLGPLVMRYRLQVLNHAPSEHEPIGMIFVLVSLLTVRAGLAALGLIVLQAHRFPSMIPAYVPRTSPEDARRAMIVELLFVAPTLLLGYGLLGQGLQHRGVIDLPRVLPTYHFHLYLKAAESLLCGVGLAAAARFIVNRGRPDTERTGPREALGIVALLVLAIVGHFPGYRAGKEFVQFRNDSLRIGADADRIDFHYWLHDNTLPTDVFLAPHGWALWTLAATDRKCICLEDQYSNLYVDYGQRAADMEKLYASLRDRDATAFDTLADQYRIGYVLVASKSAPESCRAPAEAFAPERFALVYNRGIFQVYRRQ